MQGNTTVTYSTETPLETQKDYLEAANDLLLDISAKVRLVIASIPKEGDGALIARRYDEDLDGMLRSARVLVGRAANKCSS